MYGLPPFKHPFIQKGTVRRVALESYIRSLLEVGAVCIPQFITKDAQSLLLNELSNPEYQFIQVPSVQGEHEVKQNFSRLESFKFGSEFYKLRYGVEWWINRTFYYKRQKAFDKPLYFNEMLVQRYPINDCGISPHRDLRKHTGIIAILILNGDGDFVIYNNREGDGRQVISAQPRDLLLLRAPGFCNQSERPFHGVEQVRTIRTTVGFRRRELPTHS